MTNLTDLSLENHFIGPYCLTRKLGAGGFAPVWLADELHDGRKLREVAVKLFLPPASESSDAATAAVVRDQIIEEARSLSRVEHPTIVRFYSLQQDATTGLIGLVMEYIAGRSILERMQNEGPLDEKATLEVAISVAWALAAVHDAGLVHRDIKPGNVVESANGYRLIDFGIATAQSDVGNDATLEIDHGSVRMQPESAATPDDTTAPILLVGPLPPKERILGTPGYIAPEYLTHQSPASAASDLYGLGSMIYKLLTLKVPAAVAASLERNATSSMSREVLLGKLPAPRLDAFMKRPIAPALVELAALLVRPDPRERPRHADWVARELEKIRALVVPGVILPRSSSPGGPPKMREEVREAERHEKKPSVRVFDTQPPFVGRKEERKRIEHATADVLAGGVRFVLVSGAFGTGRTRLLDMVIDDQTRHFPIVIRLHASPERRGPLRPWSRAIEQLRSHPSFAVLGPAQTAIERALAPQVLGAPNELEQALEGVEDALLAASRNAPLLVAFDDLQWADAYSLTLLSMILERAGTAYDARLLVVAAVRTEPNAATHLKAFLRRARTNKDVVRLPLEALSQEEAIAFAQGFCPMARELQQAVLRVSGNVPFFMVHALRAWHETGAVFVEENPTGKVLARLRDERVLVEDVPGVGDFIDARLGSLFETDTAEERAALRTLAAIALYGGALTFDVLEKATKIEDDVLESVLETLLGAGILCVEGERQEYAFAQEMVRQAVLNLTRRKPWFPRVFRALLDVLAEGPKERQDAAFLARGYDKLGEQNAARKWLARAMAEAFASGLFADAVEFGERRMALSASADERVDCELEIVQALVTGRKFEDARQRLENLEQRKEQVADSPVWRVLDLRRRIYRLFVAKGLRTHGILDETLVPDADALGDPLLSCEARMAAARVSKDHEALALVGDAIELAVGCSETLEFAARVLRGEIQAMVNSPDFGMLHADLTRALAIAKSHGSTWKQIEVESDWAAFEAETGKLDAAILRLQKLASQTEEFGMSGLRRLTLLNLSAFLLRANRAVEALETSAMGAKLAKENGDPDLWATVLSLRADALRRTGALKEALETVNEVLDVQRRGWPRAAVVTLLRRAEILDALGKGDEGLNDAQEARRISEEHGMRDLEFSALLWERTRLARSGRIAASELADAVATVKNANLMLRTISLRFLAEAEQWLEQESRHAALNPSRHQ